jgi:2-polyprenyl-3-methyl-5-hydroxy-6-metoxy-1,4-benzoquinol methylase
MLQQTVKNYSVISHLTDSNLVARGNSASPKGMIFHILEDNKPDVEVLDIGFGGGHLGELIRSNAETSHWAVDGIDGFLPNCHNLALFEKKLYRNVWHGLAQSMPSDMLSGYKIICLLDVIEHLTLDTAKWLLRTLLTGMGKQAFLFISTPLWFYPQGNIQSGDLEEHLIGVPASSMLALMPHLYAVSEPLVGGFVLSKRSLDFIEFFHPTTDKNFSYERGMAIARAVKMQCTPGYAHQL